MTTVWTTQDTVDPGQRPGAYTNFSALASINIRGGVSGVVAATVRAPWGPLASVKSITTLKEITDLYQRVDTGNFNAWFVLSNILRGGANEILVYRVNGPAAAKGTLAINDTTGSPVNVMDFFGKYEGARANNFTVTIANNPSDVLRKDITIKESATQIIKWTTRLDNGATGMIDDIISQVNDDVNNHYVTLTKIADGNDILANIADVTLASGADDEGNIVAADYTEAHSAFELENFEFVYFETQEADIAGIIATITTWITGLRSAGKKITWITGSEVGDAVAAVKTEAEGFNSDGIVHVHPGIKVNNLAGVETTYPGYIAASRIAGMLAGLQLNDSPTFKAVPQINDLQTRFGNADVESLITSGVLVMTYDGASFRIEKGVNSLSTPSSTQNDTFKKIRPVRILDNINNVLNTTVSQSIVGRVNNNKTGQDQVLAVIRDFLASQARDNLIADNFTVTEDVDNPPTLDRYFVSIGLIPIDAIEFIYLTITV